MNKIKCTLWPSGEVIELNQTETLLTQLKAQGKKIKSSCGGCASCSDCVFIVKSGEENLTPQTFEELRLLGNVFHITKERLSCQTKVVGDVTIDISLHDKNTFTGKNEKPVSKPNVILKKKEDIPVISQEDKSQEKNSPGWFKHWEKDQDNKDTVKKLGGNKRPKPFQYSDSDKDQKE